MTVLMAVHNGRPYLRTAMDSILAQTYRDFRFLIVDDASTDDTREVIRSYQDDRIEMLCLETNVGQTAGLSVGLRHASTPWIARMDADDYSAPTRFEEQMKVLETDPSIGCLGTHAWTFRDDPQIVEGMITTRLTNDEIKLDLLEGSPIIHGSIIVSRQALLDVGGYNDHYRHVQDVELYDRLLARITAANIPRPLLGVRRHPGQGARTMRARDEAIEILTGRLASGNYNPAETRVIRRSLARAYVSRARQLGGERRFGAMISDFDRARNASPKAFVSSWFKMFIGYLLPERGRAYIRRVLIGLKTRMRTS